MNKQNNAETAKDTGGSLAAMQEQQQKPNVQSAATSRENEKPANQSAPAGGELAAALCSAGVLSSQSSITIK